MPDNRTALDYLNTALQRVPPHLLEHGAILDHMLADGLVPDGVQLPPAAVALLSAGVRVYVRAAASARSRPPVRAFAELFPL